MFIIKMSQFGSYILENSLLLIKVVTYYLQGVSSVKKILILFNRKITLLTLCIK